MPFADSVGSGEKKNNVYIKGLAEKPANPSFEVNHPSGEKTVCKALVDVEFVSIGDNLFTSEEWGDKMQGRVTFIADGIEYQLSANLTLPMQNIINSLLGAELNPGDKFSIQLGTKDIGKKIIGTGSVIVNGKAASWKYTYDEIKALAETEGSTEAAYYKLLKDANKPLEEVLEEEAAKVEPNKSESSKKKKVEEEDDLPFN